MITNFNELFAELKAKGICKKMVAAWGVDSHTIEAASLATDMGFVKVTLVGDQDLIAKVCQECSIDMYRLAYRLWERSGGALDFGARRPFTTSGASVSATALSPPTRKSRNCCRKAVWAIFRQNFPSRTAT